MAKLVAFYSRADENYFGGTKKYISEGNTKKAAEKIAELTVQTCLRLCRRCRMRQIMIPALLRQSVT